MRFKKEMLKDGLVIKVETQEKWDKLMKTLEEETNFKWREGQKPTQDDSWEVYEGKSCIYIHENNRMTFGYLEFENGIELEELFGEEKEMGKIDLETFKGRIIRVLFKEEKQLETVLEELKTIRDIKGSWVKYWATYGEKTDIVFENGRPTGYARHEFHNNNAPYSEYPVYTFEELLTGGEEMYKMKKVAKMFGVELGEEFEIENASYNPYHFSEKGLIDVDGEYTTNLLHGLLIGEKKMIKIFEPKVGDIVYYFDIIDGEVSSDRTTYTENKIDKRIIETVGVYKTEDKAIEQGEKMLEKMKEMEV